MRVKNSPRKSLPSKAKRLKLSMQKDPAENIEKSKLFQTSVVELLETDAD